MELVSALLRTYFILLQYGICIVVSANFVALRIHLSDSSKTALDMLGGFDFVGRGIIEVKVRDT